MGKAKKGKRNDKDNDFSNSESDGDDVSSITESLKELKVEKKVSKKDKKSKQAQAESDPESDTETAKKQKSKKGKKKGSFDSDDEGEDDKPKSKAKQKKGKRNQDEDSDEEETEKAKGKVKQKKGKKNKEESDEDEPKIKEKKGKKGKKGGDSDGESEEEKKPKGKKKGKKDDDESDDESKAKSKKGAKKGKKGDDDEEEKPKKGKKKKADDDDDDDFGIIPSKPTSRGGAAKSGFALLDVEGDDDENDMSDQMDLDDEEDEKPVSVDRNKKGKNQKQEPQEPQGKKGKKGKDRKKRHDSDDDIEKVLAELEMEYSGQKKSEPAEVSEPKPEAGEEESTKDKKKDKKEKAKAEVKAVKEEKDEEGDEAGSSIKTAAQKKKEKKEREKAKKLAQKKAEAGKKGQSGEGVKEKPAEKVEKPGEVSDGEAEAEEAEGKKKKKKKGEKEDDKKGKGPGKKTIVAMQEALKKLKEEEERLKREEEERIRQEELQEQARLEQLRLEQEKKDKKKLKEKQRKERLKAEGKLLTNKQKQDRARAQDLINSLKAQGVTLPDVGEKIVRPGTRIKPKKQAANDESKVVEKKNDQNEQVELQIVDKTQKPEEDKKVDEVKDSWDAESSDDEDKSEETSQVKEDKPKPKAPAPVVQQPAKKVPVKEPSVSESESESASESSSESSSEEESEDEKMTDAERKRERARQRIQTRRIEAQKKKTLDDLRAAVVCVLGHVDTGKTKILDKLRRTNVQDSEAGGITQQIGATNVPIDAIRDSTRHVKNFAEKPLKLPGLLIIDTPGHESFSNLRNRGSSLCDIAILVVDIMHGLEPQTIESLNLLKKKKCPFVVALNKIDRLYDWQTMNRKDVHDIIKAQAPNTQREFEKRAKEVVLQFAEQGLNAAIYYENPNPRNYVSLVPTSAITGEGMGNLLALIVDACQGPLAKELMFCEELQAIVLEVKALPGLGTTIDCILVNGTLREGDTMIVAGTDGPIVTQIRSLLMPQPLKELRVKNAYIEHREVRAAQGVKIAAKDLEKAIAGLNLQVAQKPDEVEILKEEIAKELTSALGNIKLAERGVYVQASTLGALEALLDFLKTSKIPYAGIRIGPVVKKDVMKASIMLEHDSQYATILAFDVKIERDAQELADAQGVKIFQADIIYHLFDKFTAYREELRQRKRDEFKHIAVFPCKLKILPQFIFNSRDPIIMGVMVEAGVVKEGTPVCVPSREFVDLGVVTSIEYNHKPVESARKGQEVCVKIEPVPGEAPKMFGRHFDEKDFIVSRISRQSIDACKEYFRDDLVKTDWQLMLELKKLFQIL